MECGLLATWASSGFPSAPVLPSSTADLGSDCFPSGRRSTPPSSSGTVLVSAAASGPVLSIPEEAGVGSALSGAMQERRTSATRFAATTARSTGASVLGVAPQLAVDGSGAAVSHFASGLAIDGGGSAVAWETGEACDA